MSRLLILILLAVSLGVGASEEGTASRPLLKNGSFEVRSTANASLPLDWSAASPWTEWSIDEENKAEGKQSIRIARKPQSRFGGVAQSVPVAGILGDVLHLRGKVRTDSIGPEGATIWLRAADSSGKVVGYASSDARKLTGSKEWALLILSMQIPKIRQACSWEQTCRQMDPMG